MKKTVFLLSTLLLTACAYTQSGSPTANSSSSQTAAQQTTETQQAAPVDPNVTKYFADLPAVTANPDAVFPQLNPEVAEDEALVIIHTTKGDISIKLFPKYAPLAVQNFLTQAKEGQYNDVTLGTVGENYILQSSFSKRAASIWKDVDPSIDPGTGFANEVNPNLYHLRGAVSMADMASSFFIDNQRNDVSSSIAENTIHPKIVEAYKNGGINGFDGYYPVFGQTISGFEVLDAIEEAGKAGESVTMSSIEVVKDYAF